MPVPTIATTDPDILPAIPGAYLLQFRMAAAVALPLAFDGRFLAPGHYAYAGSARGPGGIRARCRRHLVPRGVCHWHVDWLTNSADKIVATAFPDGEECALIERLAHIPETEVPIQGFGSSDCRQCPAHLVRIAPSRPFEAIAIELRLAHDQLSATDQRLGS